MDTSFTSALPRHLPSNISRTEPHFRRRSHNITLKQPGEDVPRSPSLYVPSTPHQPEVSPFDHLIDKLRDPLHYSRLGDTSQIAPSRPNSHPDSGHSEAASSRSPGPSSSSGRQGQVSPSLSSPFAHLWSSILHSGGSRSSFLAPSPGSVKEVLLIPPKLDDAHTSETSSRPLAATSASNPDQCPDFDLPCPFDSLLIPTSIRLVDPLIATTSSANPYVSPESALYPDYSQQPLTSPKPPALFTLPHSATFADYGLPSPRLFSSIAHHTSNFTRKFPLPWRSVDKFNTQEYVPLLEQDASDDRSKGSKGLYTGSKRGERDGYGLDGDSIRIGRWTSHKWALILSVSSIFVIGVGGILASVAIWLRTFLHADVIQVVNWDLVLYSTVASGCLLVTSLVGITGSILNSRPFLVFYNILLWPCLISAATVGYTSYKRRTFNLLGKINEGWSREWGDYGRLVIQNSLQCCGLYNPLHQATFSKTCYARTTLPPCRPNINQFQISTLSMFTRIAFSAIGVILVSIMIAVVCSNHVNRLFGKGLMPTQYRLRLGDVHASAHAVSLKSLSRAVQPQSVMRPGFH